MDDDLRSVSYGGNNGRTQPELYYEGSGYKAAAGSNIDTITNGGLGEERPPTHPNNLHDLRCHSASYATGSASTDLTPPPIHYHHPKELKKGKSTNGAVSRAWCFSDPEMKRKRRVASYKVYTAEGKMKGSFRKSFRWVKERYSDIIHGWR